MKNLIAAIGALALTFAAAMTWPSPAGAANCSSYPYTLTNGQVADATQVMANFNNILSCGNNNLAKNGTNSDITSITGLLTPLSAAQGGTGLATSIFATANTWTVNQTFATSTTSIPSINIPPGVAPSAPTNGDIWATSTGVFARVNGVTGLLSQPPVVHVRHLRATTLPNNETFGASAWTTRALETVITNTLTGASLASNAVTLPAGTYDITVNAPVCSTNGGNFKYKHRLYNVTGAAALLYSLNGRIGLQAGATDDFQSLAPLIGQFTLASSSAVRLEVWGDGSASTFYNCGATGDGSSEIYIDVYIRKIG